MCASGGVSEREGWEEGRECDGTTALCFLCRSLLFFRARKMGLCNSHVISPEIVVGLQLLPLLLPAAPLLGFWQQPDRHTALRSPLAPKKKKRKKTAAARPLGPTTTQKQTRGKGADEKSARKNTKHVRVRPRVSLLEDSAVQLNSLTKSTHTLAG